MLFQNQSTPARTSASLYTKVFRPLTHTHTHTHTYTHAPAPPIMDRDSSPASIGERHLDREDSGMIVSVVPSSSRISKLIACQSRGPPTPSMTTPAVEYDQQLVMGSPPPPPTPAASPGPPATLLDWGAHATADDQDNEEEQMFIANVRSHFKHFPGPRRTRILANLLGLCTPSQLSFVHQFVSPLLKKDPFRTLPDELCMRVSRHIQQSWLPTKSSYMLTDTRRYCRSLMTQKYYSEHPKFLGGGVTS